MVRLGSNNPLRVVVTGGPCAGKTELWRFLGRHFHQAALIPEAASELILAGETPERVGREAFQKKVFHMHLSREEEAIPHAGMILCDRGLPDGLAYFQELDKLLGLSAAKLLERYDLVLHLAVIPDSETYLQHARINPARSEDHRLALVLEFRIREIYGRHPGYFYLGGTLEQKMSEALRIVEAVLASRSGQPS